MAGCARIRVGSNQDLARALAVDHPGGSCWGCLSCIGEGHGFLLGWARQSMRYAAGTAAPTFFTRSFWRGGSLPVRRS